MFIYFPTQEFIMKVITRLYQLKNNSILKRYLLSNHGCMVLSNKFSSEGDPLAGRDPFAGINEDEKSKYIEDLLRRKPQSVPLKHAFGKERTVLLFSGQGSQKVGMVQDLLQYPNVKEMFSIASSVLNFDLLQLCQEGPQSELDRTVNCQPAIFLTSLAAVEKLSVTEPEVLENCCAAAGYSVGEYAALVFSGALKFEDALKLVKLRARSMQAACDRTQSSMVSAIGGRNTKFKQICAEALAHCHLSKPLDNPVCSISAYLSPNFVTIGGNTEIIDHIRKNYVGRDMFSIRKLIDIPVSGAFHTKLMLPSADDLRQALRRIPVQDPLIKVYNNVTGHPYYDAYDIRKHLPNQVTAPVKWEMINHAMLERDGDSAMPLIYDVGPGKQLGSFLKKCNGRAYKSYIAVNDLSAL